MKDHKQSNNHHMLFKPIPKVTETTEGTTTATQTIKDQEDTSCGSSGIGSFFHSLWNGAKNFCELVANNCIERDDPVNPTGLMM